METLKTIACRKSTRAFRSEQISADELKKIIDAGCAAPVAMGDTDTLHLTIVQNSDILKEISLLGGAFFGRPDFEALYKAPLLVVISSKPDIADGKIGTANAACIIENMCLAATDLGIGSVYIMGASMAIAKNEELLGKLHIPEGFIPLSSVALGYPVETLDNLKREPKAIKLNTIK